ncbi:Phos pyr kin domain containing protein [Trichuris trichiura]|uniref:Pyridoxal kinase n=1 Tax=Trichuris trichiura TaxID=36087 RepID=A0A077YWQ3_TRITR|nr:Phos pyr kin domain containing protein [Trichuris trichiura]
MSTKEAMAYTDNDAHARVLSIQSHVVSGYAGNKCAIFPMQVHGFEVDTINSVQFSNHTGYAHFKGHVLGIDQLKELYEGLRLSDLLDYTHCLTGYVRDQLVLEEICKIIGDLRGRNSKLFYVCDPVMGDNGEFYVSKSLLTTYANELVPMADIITPNQFELEVLTKMKVKCEDDVILAMKKLLDTVPKVVVTSTELDVNSNRLCGYFGERSGERFVGTGDLFSSLLLVWLHKSNGCLLVRFQIHPYGALTPKSLELRIVQSVDHLINPKSSVKITPKTTLIYYS